MLHRSGTWPVRKENEVALQRAEMRMVRWMCGMMLQDRIPSKGLRERLALDTLGTTAKQVAMVWVCVAKRRHVCSMKWRVPDQELDQRGPGERWCKKTVKHVN